MDNTLCVAVGQRFQERSHAGPSIALTKPPRQPDPIKKLAPEHPFNDEKIPQWLLVKVEEPVRRRRTQRPRRKASGAGGSKIKLSGFFFGFVRDTP